MEYQDGRLGMLNISVSSTGGKWEPVRAIYMFCKQIAADVNRLGRSLILDLQINFMGQGYVLRPCESKSEMPFLR